MRLMIAGSAALLVGFAGIALASTGLSYPPMALPLLLIGFGGGLRTPMATSMILSTVDKKHSGITSGIATATGQLGASIGVAIFGAFLGDADRIAKGTRIAATIAAAANALAVLVIWQLWRQRDRAQRTL
jgi:DHA2 family methylenomycin A resistance protein-like MFS transporter